MLWYECFWKLHICHCFPPLHLFTTKFPIMPPLSDLSHPLRTFSCFTFDCTHGRLSFWFPNSHCSDPQAFTCPSFSITRGQPFSVNCAICVPYCTGSVAQSISQIILLLPHLEKGLQSGLHWFGMFSSIRKLDFLETVSPNYVLRMDNKWKSCGKTSYLGGNCYIIQYFL